MYDTRVVKSADGTWEGRADEKGIISFLGIPFAKPPVGHLRWRAPQKPDKMKGVYKAYQNGPIPIQIISTENSKTAPLAMSEDCLYLNIWLSNKETGKKAVLFWIYGGSYVAGHNHISEYSPEELVRKNRDILVVVPNYRLGILASLNLSSVDSSGEYGESCNLALLDQRMAMKWVHDNIESFGGDPENVTLFGHSAGSNAITHHLLLDESRKYFNTAKCESSFFPDLGFTTRERSLAAAETFFQISQTKQLKQLLELSPQEILEAQKQLYMAKLPGKEGKLFSPVADGMVVSEDPFADAIKRKFPEIPVMLGTSQGEYDQMFIGLSSDETRQKVTLLNQGKLMGHPEIIEKYLNLAVNMPEKEVYMDLQSDLYLRVPGLILAEAFCVHTDVYVFYFSKYDHKKHCRAGHGAMNPYIFGNIEEDEEEISLSEKLMGAWAAFIRNGNPWHERIPKWPAYDRRCRKIMVIDREWEIRQDYLWEQYELLAPFLEEGRRLMELENE